MVPWFDAQRTHFYMSKALQEAQKAFAKNEVPIGAVVVNKQGIVIARAHNVVERDNSQAAHAEMRVLSKAGKKLGDWRLNGHWLFVTLEPCSMCMSMIYLSRLDGVVYGAPSPLFGHHLDKEGASSLYKKDSITVIPDICSQESAQLLKKFFQEQRKKSE